MIPEPNTYDLARDAEADYKLCLDTDMISALGEYTPTETLQWIRRAVAAERERDELRAEVDRLRAFCIGLRKSIEGGDMWAGDMVVDMVGDLHLDLVNAIEGRSE